MPFKDKKLWVISVIYILFSLPAILYVGYKTVRKIHTMIVMMGFNEDFYLENESWGGGGGVLLFF
jgi:hypothetical protein